MLVVNGAGGAGQVINLVDFKIQRKGDVVPDEFKSGVVQNVFNVAFAASEEVVGTNHFVAARKQAVDKVATQKAGTAGD